MNSGYIWITVSHPWYLGLRAFNELDEYIRAEMERNFIEIDISASKPPPSEDGVTKNDAAFQVYKDCTAVYEKIVEICKSVATGFCHSSETFVSDDTFDVGPPHELKCKFFFQYPADKVAFYEAVNTSEDMKPYQID